MAASVLTGRRESHFGAVTAMKFKGYTNAEDWNIQTLIWMMVRREYWSGGTDWKDWRLFAGYTWYDGPIWSVCIGPFWVCISVPR